VSPKYIHYKLGDLVINPVAGVVGIITRSNYWVEDEYLSDESEVVNILFGEHESTQYPIEYIEKLR
jgi:hypothetical protein